MQSYVKHKHDMAVELNVPQSSDERKKLTENLRFSPRKGHVGRALATHVNDLPPVFVSDGGDSFTTGNDTQTQTGVPGRHGELFASQRTVGSRDGYYEVNQQQQSNYEENEEEYSDDDRDESAKGHSDIQNQQGQAQLRHGQLSDREVLIEAMRHVGMSGELPGISGPTSPYPTTTSGRMTVKSSEDSSPTLESNYIVSSYTTQRLDPRNALLDQDMKEEARSTHAHTQLQTMNREYFDAQMAREQSAAHNTSNKRATRQAEDQSQPIHSQRRRTNLPQVPNLSVRQASTVNPRHRHPPKPPGTNPPSRPNQLNTNSFSASVTRPSGHQVQEYPAETEMMDYDLETLHKMKFDDLLKESFDIKHPKSVFASPTIEGSSLMDRLAIVSKGNHDEQAQFLTSLSTEEWEQTGSWFIEQFSTMMQKIQESRRSRRKVALAFEKAVAQRHEAVRKESDNLDTALKDMRRNGDAVLQSTPKKN